MFKKKVTPTFLLPDDDTAQRVEILADGQQFLAYAIHPDTDHPYTWSGGEPLMTPIDDLPALTGDLAESIIQLATAILQEEIVKRRGGQIKSETTGNGAAGAETDEHGPKPAEQLFAILNGAVDGAWHDPMRDVVASLVGQGYSDDAIRLACGGQCRGGFHDADLTVLIETARKKFQKPEPVVLEWDTPVGQQHSEPDTSPRILSPQEPLKSARAFVDTYYTKDGTRLLHHYRDEYRHWSGSCYPSADGAQIRAAVYGFLDQASIKSSERLKPFKPNQSKVTFWTR